MDDQALWQYHPSLIFYGGTFDPPHVGHLHCVLAALRCFPRAKILVLPAVYPAGASGSHKSPQTSFKHRMAMCQLAFGREALKRRVELSDCEAQLPSPNYSLSTICHLKLLYPGLSSAFLMGADQWLQFPEWREPLRILSECSLIITPRGGYDAEEADQLVRAELWLKKNKVNVCQKKTEQGNILWMPDTRTFLHFLPEPAMKAASSSLRKKSAQSGMWEQQLPSAVLKYIEQHRLYRSL